MPIQFDSETIDVLSNAYVHELHNMYSYQKISNFLDVKGYKNLSKYWDDWSKEEYHHAQLVKEFCNDNNILINMDSDIQLPDFDLENFPITYFVEVTYNVEQKTNDIYNKMYSYALSVSNGFLIDFSLDFLKEQREEMSKANSLRDSIKNIGDNTAILQLYDNSFKG